MSKSCCTHTPENQAHELRYRRVLWAVLCINLALFLIEIIAGLTSRSAALRADALDFLGDAANYAVSLYAIRLNLRYRAGAALVKGVTMGLFGVAVLITALQYALFRTVPEPMTMGAVGILALLANGISFILLWAYQRGDSNMRSVWLCSRNDVIGNFAVLLAALGVFGTGTNWPDIIVAVIMAAFALQGAWVVTRLAWKELAGPRSPGSAGVEVCDRGQLNFRRIASVTNVTAG